MLAVDLGPCAEGVRPGDSVAVDGVCLTARTLEGRVALFDVGPESLERTTLGRLRARDRVNLERALQLGGRLDGHLVQGHIDRVGEVRNVRDRGRAIDLQIAVPGDDLRLAVDKGSVAIAGVSLTINAVRGSSIEVSLVPFTQAGTNLPDLRAGHRINIEFDIIGRYVARLLAGSAGGRMDAAFLKEHGFV